MQESPMNPMEVNAPQFPQQKKRSIIQFVIIIIIILALAGAVYYWYWQKQQSREQAINLPPSEVAQLPGDERQQVLGAQLDDLEFKVNQLTAESDKGDRFSVYIQLAEVYTGLGRHDDAVAALDKIRDEQEGNTRLWMSYAQIYKNKGDNFLARKHANRAIMIDDELVDNWLFYLAVLSDLPKDQQEISYKTALEKTHNDPKVVAAYEQFQTSPQ